MSSSDAGIIRLKGASLLEFIAGHDPAAPQLPLTHVMDVLGLEQQLGLEEVTPEACDVFCEDVLYLFYGRPAFRPNMGSTASTLQYLEPVCFVFKPEALTSIARLYLFDTGAHHLKFYESALHKKMERDDFLLPANLESARRAVTAFFGTNRDYLLAHPRSIDSENLDQRAKAYVELIHDRSQREADDRSSAIEVQTKASLALRDNLLAIVASSAQCVSLAKKRALVRWMSDDVALLPFYAIGRSNPRETFGAMRQVAIAWLDEAGYLA